MSLRGALATKQSNAKHCPEQSEGSHSKSEGDPSFHSGRHFVSDCFVGHCPPRNDVLQVMAKIRYNSKTSPATVNILENNQVRVKFDEPQSAITSGQACVFYDESDQILLGGGWIV